MLRFIKSCFITYLLVCALLTFIAVIIGCNGLSFKASDINLETQTEYIQNPNRPIDLKVIERR